MKRAIRLGVGALLMVMTGCQSLGAGSADTRRSANGSCYRHIYNSSRQGWTFTALAGKGNLHFINMPGCIDPNGPCTVPAGTTAEIQYTTTDGVSAGYLLITDAHLVTKGFVYLGLASQCPRLSHDGDTGSISLNDPANGDLSAQGDFW